MAFLKSPPFVRKKLPPRKCLICALVGFCGVGASGSTVAMTKGPLALLELLRENVGGPAVASMGRLKAARECRGSKVLPSRGSCTPALSVTALPVG